MAGCNMSTTCSQPVYNMAAYNMSTTCLQHGRLQHVYNMFTTCLQYGSLQHVYNLSTTWQAAPCLQPESHVFALLQHDLCAQVTSVHLFFPVLQRGIARQWTSCECLSAQANKQQQQQ